MVSTLDHLNNVAACDFAENVTVGNGEGLQIGHMGTAKLSSFNTSICVSCSTSQG